MLYLFCPTCQRDCDETELSCGGQAHLIRRDHASSDKDFYKYLYERKNDKKKKKTQAKKMYVKDMVHR